MSKIYQTETLFQEKMSLNHLKQRVESALQQQQHTLVRLNHGQKLWKIDEIHWDTMMCFCSILDSSVSFESLKKLIRCLLIEHFGEKALQLKIVISPSTAGQVHPG